jgi:putative transposase
MAYCVVRQLTCIDAKEPIVVSNFRSDSNTGQDFFEYVRDLVLNFYLFSGDVLVIDNAPVHCANAILTQLRELLAAANVRLWFLPKYSPELNPCELVFAQVKGWLRRHRSHTEREFWVDMLRAFSRVTLANVCNYYARCLNLESH